MVNFATLFEAVFAVAMPRLAEYAAWQAAGRKGKEPPPPPRAEILPALAAGRPKGEDRDRMVVMSLAATDEEVATVRAAPARHVPDMPSLLEPRTDEELARYGEALARGDERFNGVGAEVRPVLEAIGARLDAR